MKRSEVTTPVVSTDTVTISHDPVNEQVILAACIANDGVRDKLIGQLRVDAFLVPLHRQIWNGLLELSHKKLAYDPATLQQILGQTFDMTFVVQLQEARPDVPTNLDHHVKLMLWDQARFKAVAGPIASLLAAIKDNRTEPAHVRGLAKQVSSSFEGYEERKYLRDGVEVVREQVLDIRERMAGRACYPFGLNGLDYYERGHRLEGASRLIPGCKPGKVSVIVGVPGGGKSLLTTRLMLGMARLKKKVLCGAWEMTPGEIIELAACQSLNLSRDLVARGKIDDETLYALECEMDELRKWITFMEIPFNRGRGDKKNNDHNLDLVHGYIADSGCDVFVADLFKRCLRYTEPDDEEQALIRVQAMLQELHVHGILVQQLRMKDLEARKDKRPTRESIKGSGAWIEVPDNIFGVHRTGLFKNIPDNYIDVILLKQRFGVWPMQVQFDCDVVTGFIGGGTTVEYLHEIPTEHEGGFLAEDDEKPARRHGH